MGRRKGKLLNYLLRAINFICILLIYVGAMAAVSDSKNKVIKSRKQERDQVMDHLFISFSLHLFFFLSERKLEEKIAASAAFDGMAARFFWLRYGQIDMANRVLCFIYGPGDPKNKKPKTKQEQK